MVKHIPKFEKDPLEQDNSWLIVCERCSKLIGRIKLKGDACILPEDEAPPALGISVSDGVGSKDRFGR